MRTTSRDPMRASRREKKPRVQPLTRTADGKGRVAFGADFANKHVIVERISPTEVLVRMARVIPENEAWLYENPVALNAVRKGLAQARAGEIARGPDIAADAALARQIED